MKKPLIYITRKIPNQFIAPYAEQFEFKCWEHENEPVPRSVLLEQVKEADALLCMLSEDVNEDLMKAAPHLKIIANLAVGFDNIDIAAAESRRIVVTNTPDVLTETTADLGFALLMATARRLIEASDFVRRNEWENWAPYLLAGTDIHQKTIGIVGMGRIGQAIARRAKGFGMDILYYNRSRKYQEEAELSARYVDFHTLLKQADFVISVVPLTKETAELFNAQAFQQMKNTGIFINISRGAVVNEEALIHALKTKQIMAAGLDVFAEEPIRSDHPLVNLDNVVALPHIGSASTETRTKMWKLCLENVIAVLEGEDPKTPIT
ncbi:2-hydroxyacid dehydrogenase [Virgibacillus salexigens]|uniref:D-glycerate dehydrogenase n=1 Tax=Virgibacillus kapii TaxID=1638645 RepID=A0ABQ2DPQ7_9BACI|nr:MULTISPECIES: D-glycerate dehydrogenase [Virgibacillus]GGJ62562.1 D-glycerate dehydrogenase [Virgibacillus kapii]